jgi:DNA-binding CsgD family transcriptional regulator
MRRRGRPPHPDVLTPREWEVLSLLRERLTNEQIAERLGITVRAARFHVSEILSKLNVSSRGEAAAWQPSPEHRRWRLQTGVQIVSLLAAVALLAGLGVLAWTVANRGGSSTETVVLPTLPPPAAPGGPEWVALEQRPLNLPTMPSSGVCPVVPGRQVSPGLGVALGGGPVYPVLDADTAIDIGQFPIGGEWLGNKMLWISPPGFTGKVLIRGGRLDGDGQVGFDNGAPAFLIPLSELRLDTAAAGAPPSGEWYNWATYTRMQAPGCYAYQVDGDGLSYTIVFRAVLTTS